MKGAEANGFRAFLLCTRGPGGQPSFYPEIAFWKAKPEHTAYNADFLTCKTVIIILLHLLITKVRIICRAGRGFRESQATGPPFLSYPDPRTQLRVRVPQVRPSVGPTWARDASARPRLAAKGRAANVGHQAFRTDRKTYCQSLFLPYMRCRSLGTLLLALNIVDIGIFVNRWAGCRESRTSSTFLTDTHPSRLVPQGLP